MGIKRLYAKVFVIIFIFIFSMGISIILNCEKKAEPKQVKQIDKNTDWN